VDLIDEAASKLRMEIDSRPADIDEVERKITQEEIEREALKREQDPASQERLAKIEKSLADLKEKSAALKARWQKEKEVISRIQGIKEQMEKAKIDAVQAERQGDLARAAEITYGLMLNLQKELEGKTRNWPTSRKKAPCSRKRWTPRTWPKWWPNGPASRSPGSWRAKSKSCCTWKSAWASGWWARKRRCRR
jgi:hypothetical protein